MREVVTVAENAVESIYVVMDEPGLGNERYHRVRHAARAAAAVSVPEAVVVVPDVVAVQVFEQV